MRSERCGANPAVMAYRTAAAPATIIPTKMDPVTRTPHLSSRMPQTTRPPNTHSTE